MIGRGIAQGQAFSHQLAGGSRVREQFAPPAVVQGVAELVLQSAGNCGRLLAGLDDGQGSDTRQHAVQGLGVNF